ncbi:MAG: domain containing protein [Caulobacteraceae bacterium]|nr:domain containing protein [Caulobacteraceae bacterium]
MPDGEEIELKFEIDPAALERLEQKLILRARAKTAAAPQTLTSVYYDTPDRKLQKAGFTLRVRDDGAGRVQTVKAEAEGLSGRGEWEIELKSAEPDLQAAARTPLGPVLKAIGGSLGPVFVTRVERTRHLIRQGRSRIEAAVDRGQVEAGGRTVPLCELELELKAGDAGALYDLARKLCEGAPLRLSFDTKAARGYRLWQGQAVGEALKGGKLRLKPGMSCRQAFQAIGSAALRQAVGNAAVLRAARRPEALHQMRVGLRRLRSALKLFEAVIADDAYPRLDGELKWLTGELDQGRDIDVLIQETFRPAARRFPDQAGLAALGERLLKARTRAYDRVLATLDTPRYLTLALDLAAWIENGRWAQAGEALFAPRADAPVQGLADDGLDALRRQVGKRGKALKRLDPASRHKLRIRAKRLRYALEFFDGLYPGRKDRRDAFLETLRALQDDLGALNDVYVARAKGLALAEGGGRAAGDSETEGAQQAFAAGLVVGARTVDEAALLDRAADHYDALMDAKRFWK